MRLLLTSFAILVSGIIYAQGVVTNACNGAATICNGDTGPFSTGVSPDPIIPPYGGVSNPSTNPNPGNQGCLASGELNPNWFILTIESSGLLEFQISAGLGGAGFLDWIMWAYDSTTCQQVSMDLLPPIACNSNASSDGLTGMASPGNIPVGGNSGNFEAPISVVTGDQFIVCFSNFSYQSGNFTVDNFGSAGICQSTASLDNQSNSLLLKLITYEDAIGIKGIDENYNMTIVDLQGRIEIQETNLTPDAKIMTNLLPPAMYFIYLESQSGVTTINYLHN